MNRDFDPQKFNIKNIFRRLAQKNDPFENLYNRKVSAKTMVKIFQKIT
jgi:DNA primase